MADFTIENEHIDELLNALTEKKKAVLTAVGLEASGNVIDEITSLGAVDTGLLRNSITFAISGEGAHIGSYTANKAKIINGQAVLMKGSYFGLAPNDNIPAVYIGTNVEYAKYVQFGTSKYPKARDFMSAPIKANLGTYKQIIEEELKKP